MVWMVAVIALVLIAAGVVVWRLRGGASGGDSMLPPPVSTAPEPAPMSDLEAALDAVSDSSGRSMRDEIEAQDDQIDQLRVDDDTGPLLRRALDSVTEAGGPDDPTDTANPTR